MFSRLKLYEEHEKFKKKVFEYIKGPKFYEIKKKVKNQINRQFLVDF